MSEGYPLLILQRAPYDGSLARAALDMVLSFAAFNQQPRILFCGAGLQQLIAGQDAPAIGRRSLRKLIDSFPLYDIDEILVDETDAVACGLESHGLPAFARLVDADAINELRRRAGTIVSL